MTIMNPLYQRNKSDFGYLKAIFVWLWKMVSVSVRYLFYQPMDEKIKTWPLVFPPKKTLIWRRHCSIGQSCCGMRSKRSIDWFLESSLAWSFFNRAFALKQNKSYARLYPFDEPIKSLYLRSFVVSVLFARFHFKVIRKSLDFSASHCVKQTNCFSRCCGRVQSQNDVIQKIEMTLHNIHTTTQ